MDGVDLRNSLDGQRSQWERALSEQPDRFGTQASEPARATVELLRRDRLTHVLELGSAQGRDTLFFAEQGFEVRALDYAASAVATINRKALDAGLSAKVTAVRHDVREPLPYPDQSFDCCYSHMRATAAGGLTAGSGQPGQRATPAAGPPRSMLGSSDSWRVGSAWRAGRR